jgi:division protein CdvB (Snf7/Vps24/ESCRT-III family)
MKLKILTPQQLVDEKLKLMTKYTEIITNANKYNERVRRRLKWALYEIEKIDRKLNAFK